MESVYIGKLKENYITKNYVSRKSSFQEWFYLDNVIENWKAGTEQVDDILVIGVRL